MRNATFLRKKSISSLTNEELRLALSQEIGIEFIVPLVGEKLLKNILLECDFYPGDLLQQFAKRLACDWGSAESLKKEIIGLIESKFKDIINSEEIPKHAKEEISKNFKEY